MKETISTKTKLQSQVRTASATENDVDVMSLAFVGTMGFISAFIGIGALICFASALINAGPVELIKGFLSAVTGI